MVRVRVEASREEARDLAPPGCGGGDLMLGPVVAGVRADGIARLARLEVMRQKREALDRPGTLSPKELEAMAALDVTVLECEEAVEVAKRDRKADKQRAEKLQWQIGENKARWDKLCAGAETLPKFCECK